MVYTTINGLYYYQTPRYLTEVASTGSPYGDPPYTSANATNDGAIVPQVYSVLVVVVVVVVVVV